MTQLKHTSIQTSALWQSAEHWLMDNLSKDQSKIHYGSGSCACCQLWINQFECEDCPIAAYTENYTCRGTPYDQALQAYIDNNPDEFHNAATTEYIFLVTLALGENPGGQSS